MIRLFVSLFASVSLVACSSRSAVDATGGGTMVRADTATVASARAAREAEGAALYAKYCSLCHGVDARGYAADHAPSLVSETFLASASDVFLTRSIREGRPGTAMAGYAKLRGGPLDDEEIASILAFLRSKGPPPTTPPAMPDEGVPAWGERIWAGNCQRCHGTREVRGEAPFLANASFLSAANDAFLRYAIVHGRPGTPMPSFAGTLDPDEISDVVAYVRSFAQPPPEPPPRALPAPDVPLGPIVINPNGKPPSFTLKEDRFVPADDVKKALDEKKRMVIVDARAGSDYLMTHVKGAISIPYYKMDAIDKLPKDGTWIIAYCACPHHASGVVVDELRKRGFPHTAILDEGILEWQRRKYPVETSAVSPASSSQTAPLRRQP